MVLLLTGVSQGDALANIARAFKPEFEAAGYHFAEVSLAIPQAAGPALGELLAGGNIAFSFSFMGVAMPLEFSDDTGARANLWARAGVPHIGIYGDSPAYYFDRHVTPGAHCATIYGFPEHAALRQRLPEIHGPIGTISPLLLDTISPESVDFTRKSTGKLLFLKNGNDPEALRRTWHTELRPAPLRVLEELASVLTADLDSPALHQIDDLVLRYAADTGLDIARLPKLRLFFIAQLDDYTRRLKSTLITRALLDLPVEIHGTGWEHVDFTGRRAQWIPVCDYAHSREMMRECLGLLDMSPNTSLAPHDRVARAFASHTLCITNAQAFLTSSVPDAREVSFNFQPESIREVAARVLAHPAHHVELGAQVAQKFSAAHPPGRAIGYLIAQAEMLRLNMRPDRPPGLPDYFIWPPKSL